MSFRLCCATRKEINVAPHPCPSQSVRLAGAVSLASAQLLTHVMLPPSSASQAQGLQGAGRAPHCMVEERVRECARRSAHRLCLCDRKRRRVQLRVRPRRDILRRGRASRQPQEGQQLCLGHAGRVDQGLD
eukprot:CAMPEP_0181219362 /NCGR_PEP_ID=MMETSP1096-20121128/28223_1 /TAXON_ID=156174 ORGANISM="Chrysochromulina ericina, Strain CCMP281" /NCGR_SAMPLE_ID=MMETSP1096 /ASSEMBLY_ACC=CAM_ASM_000453 /LENGTH=130 /DNA_ID=CAMNT_0023311713 /DNA_START=345 /DNA_END=735 /DNA_ORIENTATION=-